MNKRLPLIAILGVCSLFSAAAYPQTDLDEAIQRVRDREAAARTRSTQFEANLANAQNILARARQLQSAKAKQAEQVALRAIADNRRAIQIEQRRVERYVNAIRALERKRAAPGGDGLFGAGSVPALLRQQGGITEQEWQQAREYQRKIDELSKKWPLSRAEVAFLEEQESRRNALWRRAISVPGLTDEERQRLRLKLYTGDLTADTRLSPGQLNTWTQRPPDDGLNPQSRRPVAWAVTKLVDTGIGVAADSVVEGGAEAVGITRKAVSIIAKVKRGELSDAGAEAIDWSISRLVSGIRHPGVQLAQAAKEWLPGFGKKLGASVLMETQRAVGRPITREGAESLVKELTEAEQRHWGLWGR